MTVLCAYKLGRIAVYHISLYVFLKIVEQAYI